MKLGFLKKVKNMGIGTTSIGTNGDKVLSMASGTAPTSSPSDCIQLYAEDVTDNYTKILLHCDGTDGSTTFTDSSNYGRTISRGGNTQIDTDYKVFGTGSGLFHGTGDYLAAADSDDFNLGSSNWTIDFRIRANSLSGSGNSVFAHYTNASNYFEMYHDSTHGWKIKAVSGGSTIFSIEESSSPISTSTWYHIAIVRNGNNFNLYENGTSIGSTTSSGSLANQTSSFYIGYAFYYVTASIYWNGWIDEFRFSNGIARWTSNFTPPTEAYNITTSSELKVRDELGNITTLSPHNFSLVEQSHPLAWSYYSKNNYGEINVDMFKVVKKIEELTGEKFIYIKRN